MFTKLINFVYIAGCNFLPAKIMLAGRPLWAAGC